MRDKKTEGNRPLLGRRSVIKGVAAGAFSASLLPTVGARSTIRFKMSVERKRGATDVWTVDSDSGGLTDEGTDSPIIKLRFDEVYRFHNNFWEEHPLEFRDKNGNILLSQGDTNGRLENDSNTRWEHERDQFRFRVSEGFASQVHSYGCAEHDGMEGGVKIEYESETEKRRRERRERMEAEEEAMEDEQGIDEEEESGGVDRNRPQEVPEDSPREEPEVRPQEGPEEEPPGKVNELPNRRDTSQDTGANTTEPPEEGLNGSESPEAGVDMQTESANESMNGMSSNEAVMNETSSNETVANNVTEDTSGKEKNLFEFLMDIKK